MDRLPRDEPLFTRLERKKAQVKSQHAPAQPHLVDDLVDFMVEQVNQSRDAATVSTVTHQSSPQPSDNISILEHSPIITIQHDHLHVDTTLPHPPQYDKDASSQLLLNETTNQSTFDSNCPSVEQSTPLVVSPQNSSFPPYTKVEHSDEQTALLNPIKTDQFESSTSSQLNVMSLKQKFGDKFEKEFKEEIVEHDEDCDYSECEVKMEVGNEDDDQLSTERSVKRQRSEKMNVQVGMIRSNGGDGGEGELIGGELINQEQMESDAGQMEDVEGDKVKGNQDEDDTSAVDHHLPADNFVKHIEPDQLGNKFECDFEDCGKRTKYKTNLIRHIRTHTGERSFGCEWCGKEFTTSTQLKFHSRVHSDDRPFVCDMPDCSCAYKNKRSLRKHQLIKHNVL